MESKHQNLTQESVNVQRTSVPVEVRIRCPEEYVNDRGSPTRRL